MKKFDTLKLALILFLSVFTHINAKAQFTLTRQLRTRTEVRNGLGNLVPNDSKSAAFTSQRTRLNFGYSGTEFSSEQLFRT